MTVRSELPAKRGERVIRILVIDDSAVDREIVGGLLEKRSNFEIELAASGDEALVRMGIAVPDLVVTDLLMPGMNGLMLVSRVNEEYPRVPVVLVTAHGSEDIAVQTLRQGAASYVPKRLLSRELLPTVERVLGVASREQDLTRLMSRLVKGDLAFVLDNDESMFPPLIHYFQQSLARIGICDEATNLQVGIALDEALNNALFHGNLEVSSELRERDPSRYFELAKARRYEPPYRDRRIHVEALLSPASLVVSLRDEGPGFDPSGLPDPTEPENLEKVHGRGIFLMRTFMDEVVFNEPGNEVTMTKLCRSHGAPGPRDG
jgi:CheY-like chemotaxis protein